MNSSTSIEENKIDKLEDSEYELVEQEEGGETILLSTNPKKDSKIESFKYINEYHQCELSQKQELEIQEKNKEIRELKETIELFKTNLVQLENEEENLRFEKTRLFIQVSNLKEQLLQLQLQLEQKEQEEEEEEQKRKEELEQKSSSLKNRISRPSLYSSFPTTIPKMENAIEELNQVILDLQKEKTEALEERDTIILRILNFVNEVTEECKLNLLIRQFNSCSINSATITPSATMAAHKSSTSFSSCFGFAPTLISGAAIVTEGVTQCQSSN